MLLGLALLAWMVTERYTQPASWWLQSSTLAWVNLATGVLCLLCLLPCCALYALRALRERRQGRRW